MAAGPKWKKSVFNVAPEEKWTKDQAQAPRKEPSMKEVKETPEPKKP